MSAMENGCTKNTKEEDQAWHGLIILRTMTLGSSFFGPRIIPFIKATFIIPEHIGLQHNDAAMSSLQKSPMY